MTSSQPLRRTFTKGVGEGAAGIALATGSHGPATAESTDGAIPLNAGGRSEKGGDRGLRLHRFDQWTGNTTPVRQISDEFDWGFVHIDGKGRLFYCTDGADRGTGRFPKGGGCRVFTYRGDPADGCLTEFGRRNSFGSNPTMVWVDPTGDYVTCFIHTTPGLFCRPERLADGGYRIVPQSAGVSLVLFPRDRDGKLADPLHNVTYPLGDMPSFLHSCVWEPRGRYFVVADKGKCKLYTYTVDHAAKALKPLAHLDLPTGTAPRQLRFHPGKAWLFLNHESANKVIAVHADEHGNMATINEVGPCPRRGRAGFRPAATSRSRA
ncbi:lactonase family protein [Streptomyces fuscichromogenes]|uniref:lactonase family protein n=1 Tax=Streptomyces fuscichromogenes TaxID=1324013 RepID=UPI0037FEC071